MNENIHHDLINAISRYLTKIIDINKYETGKELAAAIDVSEATISNAKNGTLKNGTKPTLLSLENIIRICQHHEISVDEMLDLHIVKKLTDIKGEIGNIRWRINKPYELLGEIESGVQLFEAGVKYIEAPITREWADYRFLHDGDGLHKLDVVLRSGVVQIVDVPRAEGLEKDLKDRFSWLNEIRVIRLARENDRYSDADTIKAECAAFLASQALDTDSINLKGESVAFGQGYAVRRMAAQFPQSSERFKGTKWVSTLSERVRGYGFSNHTASSIVAELAARHPGSEVIYLPYCTPSNSAAIHPIL